MVTVVGIEKIEEIQEIAEVLKRPLAISESEETEIDKLRQELSIAFCRRCDIASLVLKRYQYHLSWTILVSKGVCHPRGSS